MTVGSADGDSGSDPMFAGPIKNVTVNVGREAVLECQVNSLGQYKVAELPLIRSVKLRARLSGWMVEGC